MRVLLSQNSNPKRKLAWSWELVQVAGHWVDINTHRANRVVEEALRQGIIDSFAGFKIHPEFPYADSRIDFKLETSAEKALLEVKNVTLCCDPKVACFPDAITTRGQKHLKDLIAAVADGWQAVIFFLVQRGEAESFRPADHIDPEYGRLLREASEHGVEVMAYRTRATPEEISIEKLLKILL